MGLSERKVKQRIGHDPRNLTWSNDANRFSYKHMTSLGWTDKSGIGGSDLSGNPNHIAVARKLDNSGIGVGRARKEGEELSSGAGQAGRGLEDVLRRLAQTSASPVPSHDSKSSVEPESRGESSSSTPVPNRMASRRKHLHSKRLASSSPAALAEILGVPLSSLPLSPTPISSESEPLSATEISAGIVTPISDDILQRDSEEVVATSTLSVADYFRQKLREKMLARQAASATNGSASPTLSVPADLTARTQALLDGPAVPVSGTDFEGTKVKFEEQHVVLEDLGGEAGPVESTEMKRKSKKGKGRSEQATGEDGQDEKAWKLARKEAKKLAKAEAYVKVEVEFAIKEEPVNTEGRDDGIHAETSASYRIQDTDKNAKRKRIKKEDSADMAPNQISNIEKRARKVDAEGKSTKKKKKTDETVACAA